MSPHRLEKTAGRVASRRTVVHGAVWTAAAVTIVVAAPAHAACSTTGCDPEITHAQLEGSNFRLRVQAPAGKTIASVTIGGVTAKYGRQSEEYTAKLPDSASDVQPVTITYTDGTSYTTSVQFRP